MRKWEFILDLDHNSCYQYLGICAPCIEAVTEKKYGRGLRYKLSIKIYVVEKQKLKLTLVSSLDAIRQILWIIFYFWARARKLVTSVDGLFNSFLAFKPADF